MSFCFPICNVGAMFTQKPRELTGLWVWCTEGPLIQRVPFPLQKEKIREKFVDALKTEFAGKGLRFSRGTPFLRWAQAQAGDTIYSCQLCPPCSVSPLMVNCSHPRSLSTVGLARKSKALSLSASDSLSSPLPPAAP